MWVFWAVFAMLFAAVCMLVNQYFKIPGHQIVFWSRSITVILMVPMVLTMTMPDDPLFYLAVIFSTLLVSYAEPLAQRVISEYGGGMMSRMMPLTVWFGFFLWILFSVLMT